MRLILFLALLKPVDLMQYPEPDFEPHDDQMIQQEQNTTPYLVMWKA